jgi:DNA modification methylase
MWLSELRNINGIVKASKPSKLPRKNKKGASPTTGGALLGLSNLHIVVGGKNGTRYSRDTKKQREGAFSMEKIQLMQGDCLELMKGIADKSVDCIITDPPYGMDYQSSRRIDKEKRHKKILNDKTPFVWFLYDAFRVLKDESCILVFCRWDSQEAFKSALVWSGFTVKSQIIWDREHHGMGDLSGSPAPCHDVIWFAVKGKYKLPSKRPKDIVKSKRLSGEQLSHPNEKPVDLMEQLVNSYAKENEVILDPFMGSGTTGVACLNTNRRFIGIELDETYFNIAKERIYATARDTESN